MQAFEWVVRDIHKLRDYVEGPVITDVSTSSSDEGPEEDAGDFEVLKESPMLWDGKYKLEIGMALCLVPNFAPEFQHTAKTAIPENHDLSATPIIRTQPQTLSLYITSLLMDFAHADYEVYSSMFAAIKCQDDRVGERGARAEWAWEFWQDGWVFRQESEVWGRRDFFNNSSAVAYNLNPRVPSAYTDISPRESKN